MKIIIHIPCWNEEQTLPSLMQSLPRELQGATSVEYLVVDDGSTDDTIRVARELGVNHIVTLSSHSGLAEAFRRGMLACLDAGADILNEHEFFGIKSY